MKSLKLELPYPPSNNTYYRHVGYKNLLSEKGRLYRTRVAEAKLEYCICDYEVKGQLKVTIHAHPPDARIRDLDNIPKAVLDALQWARIIESDRQIDDLHVLREMPARPKGKLIVTIEEMGTWIRAVEGEVA